MTRSQAIIPKDGRPLSLEDAFIARTRLDRAILRGANLTRANMSGVIARDADFKDAILEGTILHGADLRGARNLTARQLSTASLDEATLLPHYLSRADIASARTRAEEKRT